MEILVPSRSRSKINANAAITNKIVAAIEASGDRFRCPWHSFGPPAYMPVNAATLEPFKAINVPMLWMAAAEWRYPAALWASYKQWQSIGAQVKYGERGSLICYYKRIETTPFDPDDPDRDWRLRHVVRPSWVFNAAQVDGYVVAASEQKDELARINEADAFVSAIKPTLARAGTMARYDAKTDAIEIPEPSAFVGTETCSPVQSYYAVLLHELVHWSGARHRLNRVFTRRFGTEEYAMEEMIAELGASLLCAALGIANEPRPDHASCVDTWLRVLKRDWHAVFTAADAAQQAFEYLCYLATRNEPGERDQVTT